MPPKKKRNQAAGKPEAAKTSTKGDAIVYPVNKVVSFVSRSPSSGKRRSYDVEGVAHGTDQYQVTINGQQIFLQRAGVDALVDLLGALVAGVPADGPDGPEEAGPDPDGPEPTDGPEETGPDLDDK